MFFPQKIYIHKNVLGQDISHDGRMHFLNRFFMSANETGQDLGIFFWGGGILGE